MAHEKPGQTLDATGLVHEAYLRLVDATHERNWSGRGHFFAAAAEAMRRILVENAHRKHGGGRLRQELLEEIHPSIEPTDDDLMAVDFFN